MGKTGRPTKKRIIEEPKKPDSMLYRERQEEYLEKLGCDKKDAALMQKLDALNKEIEKTAMSHKVEYIMSSNNPKMDKAMEIASLHRIQLLLRREKQEKLEYQEKMRQYHISTSPFECTLNKAQMELLHSFFNVHLLVEPITIEELEDIFMGKDRRLTYQLKDWDLFILLFKGLSGDGFDDTDDKAITYLTTCFKPIEGHQYICKCWQKAIEDLEEFTDKKGGPLTSGKIRRRLSTIKNVLGKVHIPVDALERLFEQLVKLEV